MSRRCAPTACTSPAPRRATRPAARPAWDGCSSLPQLLVRNSEVSSRPKILAGKRVLVTAGPDRGAGRPGARADQFELRQDGLRGGARRQRSRRRGDAGERPGVARHAGGRVARRRAHRAGDVRGGEEERAGLRRVHLGGRGRRLPRQEPLGAEAEEGERQGHDARAGGEPRHPRLGGGAAASRRSASASPPRARSWRSTRRRSARRSTCR